MTDIVTSFPLFSIILALLCSVASSVLRGNRARWLTLCLLGAVIAMSASVLVRGCITGESVTFLMGHFPAPWGNEIRFGILEPFMAVVFGVVILLCLISGQRYLDLKTDGSKQHLYFCMIDLLYAAMLSLIYTNDIFTGYVFIEISTIASCGILIVRSTGRSTAAATRYMIFSLLGSELFLLGIILLYNITGHLLMPQLKDAVSLIWATGEYSIPMTVVISLLVVGLAIKCGLFPFHIWMPDTYGCALPGSAGILSGLVSKGYILLLIKTIYCVIGTDVFYASGAQNILFVFGVLGMIIGSVSAIRAGNINRMIAFSSAAQIGYIFMGIGISPTAGVLASLFHILAHAFTKPSLFLAAARLSDVSGGSKKFDDLRGAGRRNSMAGVAFTVGALSMIGLPMFMGFVSKLMFATAGVQAQWKMLPTLIALAISTILNIMYFMRVVVYLYSPSALETVQGVRLREQPAFTFSALCFIVANMAIGLHSQPIVDLLEAGLSLL